MDRRIRDIIAASGSLMSDLLLEEMAGFLPDMPVTVIHSRRDGHDYAIVFNISQVAEAIEQSLSFVPINPEGTVMAIKQACLNPSVTRVNLNDWARQTIREDDLMEFAKLYNHLRYGWGYTAAGVKAVFIRNGADDALYNDLLSRSGITSVRAASAE